MLKQVWDVGKLPRSPPPQLIWKKKTQNHPNPQKYVDLSHLQKGLETSKSTRRQEGTASAEVDEPGQVLPAQVGEHLREKDVTTLTITSNNFDTSCANLSLVWFDNNVRDLIINTSI